MTPGKVVKWSAKGMILGVRNLYDTEGVNNQVVEVCPTEPETRFLLLELAFPYRTSVSTCKVLLPSGRVGWVWSSYLEEVEEE